MNKRQKITIAAMMAVAALFAGGVLGWERISPAAKADAGASEHHEEHPASAATAAGTQPIPRDR